MHEAVIAFREREKKKKKGKKTAKARQNSVFLME